MNDPDLTSTESADDRPLGPPPAYFDKRQRACWRDIAAMAAPGHLTLCDRVAVELAACLLAQMREMGLKNLPASHGTNLQRALDKLHTRARAQVDDMTAMTPFSGSMGRPSRQ